MKGIASVAAGCVFAGLVASAVAAGCVFAGLVVSAAFTRSLPARGFTQGALGALQRALQGALQRALNSLGFAQRALN